MTTQPRKRRKSFVTVQLTHPARAALQNAKFRLQVELGREVSMSEVLLSAMAIADESPDKLRDRIMNPPPAPPTPEDEDQ